MNSTNAIIVIIISAGLFFFVGKPMLDDVSLLNNEKQSYQDAIDKVRQVEEKKNELLTKLNQIPLAEREQAEAFLPTKDGTVRLVSDIDGIASKHGISVQSFTSESSPTDISRSVTPDAVPKIYNSKILKFTFSSNFDNLSKFLIDLEASLRMIDIRSITVSTVGVPGGNSDVYSYEVGAEIYWLNDAPQSPQ